jgi:amino acid efflux transporter
MALTVVLVLPRDTTGSQQITAFSTLLQIASGHALSQAGDMVAVVLLVLSMNAWTLGTSRVVYSQARTGLLPSRLARVSGRGNAPRVALLALLAGYAVPVAALMLSGRDESTLITASSAAFLLIFLISFLAAERLLEGRTIRWCIRLVTAGTLAFLPSPESACCTPRSSRSSRPHWSTPRRGPAKRQNAATCRSAAAP